MMKDLSEQEIKKVITNMESSFIFDMDNNMGIARLLNYYQTIFGDWKYTVDYFLFILFKQLGIKVPIPGIFTLRYPFLQLV